MADATEDAGTSRRVHPRVKRQRMAHEGNKARLARLMVERPELSTRRLAEEVFLHPKTVEKMKKEILQEWKQELRADREELGGRMLAEIRRVKGEAWKAWEHRRTTREIITKSKVDSGKAGKAGKSKVSVVTEQRDLGIECLRVLLEAMRQESDLLGLAAPKQVDVNVIVGLTEQVHADTVAALLDILTPEQLAALDAKLSSQRGALVDAGRRGLPVLDAVAEPAVEA